MTAIGSIAAIDLHTHVVPMDLPGHAGDLPWPSIRHGTCGHAQVMVSGKLFREIDDRCWDTGRRAGDMEGMGIGRQVLSPMPELLSTWFPAPAAAELGRAVNATIAEMVAQAPDRFTGLGMVPLQDPDLAARELEHAVRVLGLRGVEIGTNVEGRPIGDAFFDPFFAAARALDAAIFVHPLRPAGMERLVGPPVLEQAVGFPCETALATASLITGGMLDRHPGLRIALSHGGGCFAQVLPRLQHVWSMAPGLRERCGEPQALARTLFYDSLVYDGTALRFLIDSFGIGQVAIGTDYPFTIMETEPVARIDGLGLSADDRERLLAGNARRFLGI